MERFAQLLDDVEDLLSAIPLLWERIRRALLRVGLAAATGVPVAQLLASHWAVTLALVALVISSGWLLALAASEASRIRRQLMGAAS